MPLLELADIQHAYGGDNLLDGVDLQIDKGERLCLIGRNGSGKSTLLRILHGTLTADHGERRVGQQVTTALVDQSVDTLPDISIQEFVSQALHETGRLLTQYQELADDPEACTTESGMARLAQLQHELEACDGWKLQTRIETVLSRLELDSHTMVSSLSGGETRRVMLARALVTEPDILILDEPTNHLDIATINWLEQRLLEFAGTLVFITHDRRFLQNLATRIVELDRGKLYSWPGDYENFLRRKQEALDAEEKAHAAFDKKLAQEEAWIREGIKARRTRNEGRVRALKSMREQRRSRREKTGTANLRAQQADAGGKRVVETEGLTFLYDDKPCIDALDCSIVRGDKVGIIGPNGCGKTTLLKLLLGELEPDKGKIVRGTNLQIAYFDQHRARLDPELSVADNVAEGDDHIEFNGQRRHVLGYLQDFLFSPQRARTPVKALSGGEKNRLLLAKLFARPANVLVLDEPTNDLDMETLELLEALLVDYEGTVLLVSHDRWFLDNVVTSTLVFESQGKVREYVGGYQDWLSQKPGTTTAPAIGKSKPATGKKTPSQSQGNRKLGYREQRELAALPERIETLEQDITDLQAEMSQSDFFKQEPEVISQANDRLKSLEQELSHCYERWESLESG